MMTGLRDGMGPRSRGPCRWPRSAVSSLVVPFVLATALVSLACTTAQQLPAGRFELTTSKATDE